MSLDLRIVLLLAILVGVAAWFDLRQHRVPNALTAAAALAAVAVHGLLGGLPGVAASGGGLLLLLVLTFPFFAVGWLGAGDVKLIAAVGAMVGAQHALHFLLCIVFTGLVVSLAMFAYHGRLLPVLKRYWSMIGLSFMARRGVYVDPPEAERIVVPYAVAVALGTLVAVFVRPVWVL